MFARVDVCVLVCGQRIGEKKFPTIFYLTFECNYITVQSTAEIWIELWFSHNDIASKWLRALCALPCPHIEQRTNLVTHFLCRTISRPLTANHIRCCRLRQRQRHHRHRDHNHKYQLSTDDQYVFAEGKTVWSFVFCVPFRNRHCLNVNQPTHWLHLSGHLTLLSRRLIGKINSECIYLIWCRRTLIEHTRAEAIALSLCLSSNENKLLCVRLLTVWMQHRFAQCFNMNFFDCARVKNSIDPSRHKFRKTRTPIELNAMQCTMDL